MAIFHSKLLVYQSFFFPPWSFAIGFSSESVGRRFDRRMTGCSLGLLNLFIIARAPRAVRLAAGTKFLSGSDIPGGFFLIGGAGNITTIITIVITVCLLLLLIIIMILLLIIITIYIHIYIYYVEKYCGEFSSKPGSWFSGYRSLRPWPQVAPRSKDTDRTRELKLAAETEASGRGSLRAGWF